MSTKTKAPLFGAEAAALEDELREAQRRAREAVQAAAVAQAELELARFRRRNANARVDGDNAGRLREAQVDHEARIERARSAA